ncbi:MAG: hypothetical protein MMC23_004428 [Stictis urceolatum]|nr:hypothetical protein [Stictis urceolata]
MTAVMHQPGIVSMDPLGAPSSFSARKTASSSLPGRIELPQNPLTQKFSNSQSSAPHHSQPSINNLLTPPSNISGDSLSPISSGANSANNPAAQGLPPYTPTGYWQPTGTGLTPYINGASGTPPSWSGSGSGFPPPKGMFSPSLNSMLQKSGNSPSSTETVQPPSYDLGALPPFPSSMPQSSSLPPMTAHNQAPHQPSMNYLSHQQQPSHVDGYMPRLPPTPTYYGSQPASSPQSQYPAYSTSPMNQSPVPRLSPINHPVQQQYGRPYQSYGMPGPIMSNMHSPGSQMSLVGMPGMVPTFNSGHAAHMQQMYGHPSAQPQNDRPFKCDQCPQSFNRNHDLKRHKRIHLAVKPFPCGHCDKSFSRKDALKRHILVKGCGKALSDAARKAASESDKDESSEDGGSPPQS